MESKTDIEEKLISMVQDRPCLYDKKDKNYFNKVLREGKWKEIAEIVKMNATSCQSMWTTLRNQYSKYLKKLENPTGTGRGRQPYFRHHHAMLFVKDVVAPKERTSTNLENDDNLASENEDKDPSNDANQNNIEITDLTSDDSNSALVPRSKDQSLSRPHKKFGNSQKRKLDAFEVELLEKVVDEDEFDSFCNMLAPKLRKLSENSRKSYLILQRNINNLVCDAELDVFDLEQSQDNPESKTTSSTISSSD